MLEIDTSGVSSYVAWLEEEARLLKLKVRNIYRNWAVTIHEDITRLTPQWSGNLAANWVIETNGTSRSAVYTVGPAGDQPYRPGGRGEQGPMYSRGMEPAVSISLQRAASFRMPALSDTVYIHNPVEYAQEVEDDSTDPPIRAINRLPRTEAGKVAMVHHAAAKFNRPLGSLLDEL